MSDIDDHGERPATPREPAIVAFLARHTPLVEETVVWGREPGLTPWTLRGGAHASAELPPLDAITSVRAIVFQGDRMLVATSTDGLAMHIMPGGRREHGEAVEAALHREVLEEAGWTIRIRRLVGFLHYHNLGPRPVIPPDHPYPLIYPDLFQPVYLADAVAYDAAWLVPNASEPDPFVMRPLAAVRAANLTPLVRAMLEAALISSQARDG